MMPPDLRNELQRAAGPPAGPLDFEAVVRRVRRQRIMRTGVATVAVVLLGLVGWSVTEQPTRAPVIVNPPPAETPTVPATPTDVMAFPANSRCGDPAGDTMAIDDAQPIGPARADLRIVRLQRTRNGGYTLEWQFTKPHSFAEVPDEFEIDLAFQSLADPSVTGYFRKHADANGAQLWTGPTADDLRLTDPGPVIDLYNDAEWYSTRRKIFLPAGELEVLSHPFRWAATMRYPRDNSADTCPSSGSLDDPLAAEGGLPIFPSSTPVQEP